MGNENEDRRQNPYPCDLHKLRIDNLEKESNGMRKALWGEDGRTGLNQALNDTNTTTKETNVSVGGLKKMVYLFNIPIVVAIVLMAVKYIFFGGK